MLRWATRCLSVWDEVGSSCAEYCFLRRVQVVPVSRTRSIILKWVYILLIGEYLVLTPASKGPIDLYKTRTNNISLGDLFIQDNRLDKYASCSLRREFISAGFISES